MADTSFIKLVKYVYTIFKKLLGANLAGPPQHLR